MKNRREKKMNLALLNEDVKMNSNEIANMCNKRPDNVVRTIRDLVEQKIIVQPQIEDEQSKDKLGRNRISSVYVFSGKAGMRDSIVVMARLSPEFTAAIVDRWIYLEESASKMSDLNLISHYEEEIKQLRQTIDRKNAEMSVNSTLYNDLLQKLWAMQDKMNIDTQLSDENHWLKRQMAELQQEFYRMESVVTTTQQQNRNVMLAVSNVMQIENKAV